MTGCERGAARRKREGGGTCTKSRTALPSTTRVSSPESRVESREKKTKDPRDLSLLPGRPVTINSKQKYFVAS